MMAFEQRCVMSSTCWDMATLNVGSSLYICTIAYYRGSGLHKLPIRAAHPETSEPKIGCGKRKALACVLTNEAAK